MFRPFTLLITTAALGDIAGDPTAFMSYDIWSQDEDGFFSATVSSAVYTEPEQQEVIGLPDGALLVTVTIENDWESTLPIEDLDIYVGESTSDISALVMPGYFTDEPVEKQMEYFYNAPDYVDFAYETGLFSWDWGFSDDMKTDSLGPVKQQRFGSCLGQKITQLLPAFCKVTELRLCLKHLCLTWKQFLSPHPAHSLLVDSVF